MLTQESGALARRNQPTRFLRPGLPAVRRSIAFERAGGRGRTPFHLQIAALSAFFCCQSSARGCRYRCRA
jgi:hypothetical protein